MNEEITASMTYDAKSMTPALRWHNHRQNRLSLIIGSIALVLFGLSFRLAHLAPSADGIGSNPVFTIVPGAAVAFVIFLRWLGRFLFARSIQSSPAHGKPLTFHINEDGVKVDVVSASAEYGWGHFLRSLVTPDGVLLYTQKLAFNWLPKHAFPTESDYSRFLALVAAKTKHSQIG